MELIGRQEELATLTEFVHSEYPELLAIFGRRRIGKTFLIRTFFSNRKNIVFFSATGSNKGSLKEQIEHFTQRIGEIFFSGIMPKPGNSWDETFKILTEAMQAISKKKRIVLFFDELPWMATPKSRLLQSLDYYWNQYWSIDKRVKLIVCGSSASWIIKKIINSKGGLHNRITRKIRLMPFNLLEVREFLLSRGIKLNHHQITQLYMVTGGVPYYLTELSKGLSAAQAIEKLAFKQNSMLLKEFDNLFSSLFGDAEPYIDLLKIIAKNRYGIPQTHLINQTKYFTKGGRVIEKLKELKEAGFIISFKPYQHKKRGTYYRITDEYTLFYFHWIEPIRDTLQEESLEKGYWQGLQDTPAWYSWAGYAFESICYKHLHQIRKKLEIPPTAIAYSWRYIPRKHSQEDGAQIDLLFDRHDKAITLCEIKYSDKPFVVTKHYAKNLVNKEKVFVEQTRTKKQIFIAMISAQGLADNLYGDELVCGLVTLEDLYK